MPDNSSPQPSHQFPGCLLGDGVRSGGFGGGRLFGGRLSSGRSPSGRCLDGRLHSQSPAFACSLCRYMARVYHISLVHLLPVALY